jgi:hypothetical protein
MNDHFWLTQTQLDRIKPYFPLSHGIPRVDDRRVGLPPKKWSTPIVRKGRIKDGEQTAQTGRNCNQATAG